MSKHINVANILYFYDGVQLFEAIDAIGGHYIGLFVVDNLHGLQRYLVVGVSRENFQRFRAGETDLRSLIDDRAEQDWFIVEAVGNLDRPLPLIAQIGPIPDAYLPDAGFELPQSGPNEPLMLVGRLRKVDVDAGVWRLRATKDDRDYSGKVRSGVSLSHLVTDSIYRFVCDEVTEGLAASGREVRTLYLTAFSDAHDTGKQAG